MFVKDGGQAKHVAWHQDSYCPSPPGRLSVLSIFHSKSVLHGAFICRVRRALNGTKQYFLTRADWDIGTEKVLTLWIAFAESTAANGCESRETRFSTLR